MAIKFVEQTLSNLSTSIGSLEQLKNRKDVLIELQKQEAALSQVIQKLHSDYKRKFVQTRKTLQILLNMVQGLISGLESKDLIRSDFLKVLKVMAEKHIPAAFNNSTKESEKEVDIESVESKISEEDRERLRAMVSESDDWQNALKEIQDWIKSWVKPKLQLGENAEEVVRVLESVKDARKKLPIKLSQPFQMVKVPIIPIFGNYQLNNAETFKKLGIQFIPLEGYGMLMDQMLLAVSKKVAARAGVNPIDIATEAIQLLNDKGNIDYSVVTDRSVTNPRNTDIQLFWVLPSDKVTKLIGLSGRKGLGVKWGLPF
jgi:hypothetical protein